jgi:hypothetical protein
MTTLEEQFAALVEGARQHNLGSIPEVFPSMPQKLVVRTRTVYSVGEAISQRGGRYAAGD